MLHKKYIFVVLMMLMATGFVFYPATPVEKSVGNLIEQFESHAIHWNPEGQTPSFHDSWTQRNYEGRCKIAAARMLGELGPEAIEAVPVLIDELVNGKNDIDRRTRFRFHLRCNR